MLGVLGLKPGRQHRLSRPIREQHPLGFLGEEARKPGSRGKVIARGYARCELPESAESRVQAAQIYRYSGRGRARRSDGGWTALIAVVLRERDP